MEFALLVSLGAQTAVLPLKFPIPLARPVVTLMLCTRNTAILHVPMT